MLLSDSTIKELVQKNKIKIKPFDPSLVGPSSVDLRLGKQFVVFKPVKDSLIDIREKIPEDVYEVVEAESELIIKPQQFILGHTLETIELPKYISARLEGRSSLARLGIVIHSTGGFIDAGFKGQITLEITNINSIPIKLHVGMRVAQLAFELLDKPAETPYYMRKSSKYLNQKGATLSKIYEDFK